MKMATAELGDQRIILDVTETPAEMAMGLLGRNILPRGHGMIFRFPQNTRTAFTMTGMQFPIDMIFVAANWDIVWVFERARPGVAGYLSPVPYRYVIEVPAGTYARSRVGRVRILSFPLSA